MKYWIWMFDRKTKVPKLISEGKNSDETIIEIFKQIVQDDKVNHYALRIERTEAQQTENTKRNE